MNGPKSNAVPAVNILLVDDREENLTALNAVRLTLGTKLDVSEDRDPTDIDEDDPRLQQLLVYDLFSVLLGSLIAAITH